MVCIEQGKPRVLLLLVLWCVWWASTSCILQVEAAKTSLKQGEKLNATEELCSEKGIYCLSFGLQHGDDQSLTYLYTQPKVKDSDWVIWVANRNQPVDFDSAVLLLDHSGQLQIQSKDIKDPIFLYSLPNKPLNNTVATLLDTGNFVLQQLHPNGSKTLLWQSFDYPTDTLVPGMKLGVDLKTGHNWSLVSWMTKLVPTPGAFRLEWDPRRRELIIKRREQIYWTSGQLRNGRFENILPQFNFVIGENESYFRLEASGDDDDGLTKWTLLETGQLINRDRGNDIARADLCYGYNTDGGCQKWEDIPSCRDPGDAFEKKEVYPNPKMLRDEANSSYGPSDCKAICWNNCSCAGFKEYYNDGTGCTFIVGNSTEGTNIANGGHNYYMLAKKPPPPPPLPNHKSKKNWIWICAAAAISLLIICPFILCQVLRKRKHTVEEENRKRMERTETHQVFAASRGSSTSSVSDLEVGLNKEHDDLKVFSYASIVAATNGFSSENKLGQGGFGPVYKGLLSTGQEVAVKKLSKTSRQGVIEFQNELTLISQLQHTNLVQLLGHCIHERERILIYEYMPNKSLDFFLFDSTRRKLLDWNKRFSIIEGIAQGLLYLHKYSRLRIIHRDLKASNILLDENMNPKISDFGVARLFTEQESEANTNRIIGTYGYMSPEYAMEGVFSIKSDVYSFGVLLLEIISGRRNNSIYTEERQLNLVGHAWELWKEGRVLQFLDPLLTDLFSEDEVLRCVHAGLLCVEENADDRPTMSNVISMLTNKIKASSLPKKPAYYVRTKVLEEERSSKEFRLDFTNENSFDLVHSM